MDDVRLAVCNPDEAACAGVAVRLHGASVVPWTPDGADAVMFDGAADLCEQVLRGGVHALLVANPCPPGEVIDALFAAARKSGAQLAVVNPDRYRPSRQLIKKQLGGPLGEPGLIRLHRWESLAPDRASDTLPDALLRDLDLVLWLAGRPNRVYAVEPKADAPGRFVQVHLGFAHGGMALLDYSGRLPPGDGYQSLSVIAASGAAYADDHQNAQLLYRGGNAQAVRTDERAGQLAAIAQDFVDALRAGRDLAAGAAEWCDVFVVAGAVQKSLASGRVVGLEART